MMRKTIIIFALAALCSSVWAQQKPRSRRIERRARRRVERIEHRRELPQPRGFMPWQGILPADRGIDWSTAGIPGGIPQITTQCGPTVAPSGDTTGNTDGAVIQNALTPSGNPTSCAGQVVLLGQGTFYTKGSINIPNAVVLRGQGADQTIIRMDTGSAAFVNQFAFNLGVSGTGAVAQFNRTLAVTNQTAKGDTTITVANGGTSAGVTTSLQAVS